MPGLKHGLIIDAGGYLGTAAIAFSEAYPDATVVTIEPSPENFALLVQNTAAYPNIRAAQQGDRRQARHRSSSRIAASATPA